MLGETLQQLRIGKNLSQKQLADILSLDKSTISCYENGTRFPSLCTLKSIARYFHVSTDYLLEMNSARTLDVSGLTDGEIAVVEQMIHILQENKK